MHAQKYFSIVVDGVEKFWRSDIHAASRQANKLRSTHGNYAVWVRPHFRLMTKDGSPVNL